MIKICGALLMLICSYAYTESSDLWFAQGFLIGVFFFFSEAIVTHAMKLHAEDPIDMIELQNVQA